jgi:tRNA(Arg) A34 adenosine deaminase TadA
MDDETFLREAVRLAAVHSAAGVNGPFGAVVVRDGAVVGEGWNQVVERHDPTAHAEVMAIRDASARLGTHVLEGCVLYTSCEPCPLCLAAAYWARIGRVVFSASSADAAAAGFDDDDIYTELAKSWPERRVPGEQRLRPEGRAVLDAWLANSRKIPY